MSVQDWARVVIIVCVSFLMLRTMMRFVQPRDDGSAAEEAEARRRAREQWLREQEAAEAEIVDVESEAEVVDAGSGVEAAEATGFEEAVDTTAESANDGAAESTEAEVVAKEDNPFEDA